MQPLKKFCLDVLPGNQRKIWDKLSYTKELDFILFGGTALALQLGHRQSIDFDFFRARELSIEDIDLLKGYFCNEHIAVAKEEKNSFILNTESGVQLSFFGNIPFATKEHITKEFEESIVFVASMDALLATKLKATYDRASLKDYADIAAIFSQKKTTLKKGLELLDIFFTTNLSVRQTLTNLTFFDDGDLNNLSSQDKTTLVETVTRFIEDIQKNNIKV